MSYPSILTIWDGENESRAALEMARDLARQWSSHLEVACLGVDLAPVGFYAAELAHDVANDLVGEAKLEAKELARAARDILASDDVRWSVRSAGLRLAELPAVVGKAAWFQDLVILPRPFGRADEELAEAILDAALFEAPAPTLVVPPNWSGDIGAEVLVAWNGSHEAARALRAAMPILKKAKNVNAVMVDSGSRRSGCADPGAALGAMLSRHGVNAEISLLPRSNGTVADTLQRRATDIGADMAVMGAYGHSRFRERVLGGATRDMLKTAERPIFFAR